MFEDLLLPNCLYKGSEVIKGYWVILLADHQLVFLFSFHGYSYKLSFRAENGVSFQNFPGKCKSPTHFLEDVCATGFKKPFPNI